MSENISFYVFGYKNDRGKYLNTSICSSADETASAFAEQFIQADINTKWKITFFSDFKTSNNLLVRGSYSLYEKLSTCDEDEYLSIRDAIIQYIRPIIYKEPFSDNINIDIYEKGVFIQRKGLTYD